MSYVSVATNTTNEQILAVAQSLQGAWGKSLTVADIDRAMREVPREGGYELDGKIIKTADGGEVVMMLMVKREFSDMDVMWGERFEGAQSLRLRVYGRPSGSESVVVDFDNVAEAENAFRAQAEQQGGITREVALREYRELDGVWFVGAPITLDGKAVPAAVAEVARELQYTDLSKLAAKYIEAVLCEEDDARGLGGWTIERAMAVLNGCPELRDLLTPVEAARVRQLVAEKWRHLKDDRNTAVATLIAT